jgi:hypothetical protein
MVPVSRRREPTGRPMRRGGGHRTTLRDDTRGPPGRWRAGPRSRVELPHRVRPSSTAPRCPLRNKPAVAGVGRSRGGRSRPSLPATQQVTRTAAMDCLYFPLLPVLLHHEQHQAAGRAPSPGRGGGAQRTPANARQRGSRRRSEPMARNWRPGRGVGRPPRRSRRIGPARAAGATPRRPGLGRPAWPDRARGPRRRAARSSARPGA